MGEAIYYLKARWASKEDAEDAEASVEHFLQRMAYCEDAWQDSRGGGEKAGLRLRADYRDVFDLLQIPLPEAGPHGAVDWSNYLAGELDSPFIDPDHVHEWEGAELRLSGEVWHSADWTHLADALKRLGAKKVVWRSEADMNPFEALNVS